MRILKNVLKVIYFGINIFFGFFWRAGYYYTNKILGVISILVILCLYLPDVITYIKQRRKKIEDAKFLAELEDFLYDSELYHIAIQNQSDIEKVAKDLNIPTGNATTTKHLIKECVRK